MTVLLFTVAAPLQSWGDTGRLDVRNTRKEPTKSGVIGLIANALGMGRSDSLDRFKTLRFGVRVDREGKWDSDFQTTDYGKQNVKITKKAFLADAKFTVGIEDTIENLQDYCVALIYPDRPLFFGRRSFTPGEPLQPRLMDKTLEEALLAEPGRVVVEPKPDDNGPADIVFDNPTSFDHASRGWGVSKRRTLRVTPVRDRSRTVRQDSTSPVSTQAKSNPTAEPQPQADIVGKLESFDFFEPVSSAGEENQ